MRQREFELSIIVSLALLLGGCAHSNLVVLSDEKVQGEKVLALDAPREPWVVSVEQHLRGKGFKVLRWPSQKKVTEKISETTTEEYRQSSARYVLSITGYSDPLRKCFAGGYYLDSLAVELIDTKSNETVLSYTANGYTENCAPMSGTIFSDIAENISRAWP